MSGETPPNYGALLERIDGMRSDIADIKSDLHVVSASLQQIARLEERYKNHDAAIARAFSSLNEHEARLKTLEIHAPINKMVSRWVVTGVIGLIGLVGLQAFSVMMSYRRPEAAVTIDAATVRRIITQDRDIRSKRHDETP